jgi:hypothetical protein
MQWLWLVFGHCPRFLLERLGKTTRKRRTMDVPTEIRTVHVTNARYKHSCLWKLALYSHVMCVFCHVGTARSSEGNGGQIPTYSAVADKR